MSQARIAAKLVAAGKAIQGIAKDARNDFHNYRYVTDEAVLATVRGALFDQGISFLPNVVTVDHVFDFDGKGSVFTTIRGDVTFTDSETGEQFVTGFAGTGTDKGDKGYYKAVTSGTKYVLLKALLIPANDDVEATDENGRSTRNASPSRNGSAPVPPKAEPTPSGLSPAQVKLLNASLDDAGLKSKGQKGSLLVQVVGKNSSKLMDTPDLDKVLTELKDPESVAVRNALAVL